MDAFHLAFRVDDLESTAWFYAELLGCTKGRQTKTWVDFDFFGHQLSAHVGPRPGDVLTTQVDDTAVPLTHFGVVMAWPDWESMHVRLRTAGVEFLVEPQVRFRGLVGEQGTFFICDPSGNGLEFKALRKQSNLFVRDDADPHPIDVDRRADRSVTSPFSCLEDPITPNARRDRERL